MLNGDWPDLVKGNARLISVQLSWDGITWLGWHVKNSFLTILWTVVILGWWSITTSFDKNSSQNLEPFLYLIIMTMMNVFVLWAKLELMSQENYLWIYTYEQKWVNCYFRIPTPITTINTNCKWSINPEITGLTTVLLRMIRRGQDTLIQFIRLRLNLNSVCHCRPLAVSSYICFSEGCWSTTLYNPQREINCAWVHLYKSNGVSGLSPWTPSVTTCICLLLDVSDESKYQIHSNWSSNLVHHHHQPLMKAVKLIDTQDTVHSHAL